MLPTSILQVTVSIWFTDDYAGVGQAGQPGLCPPAHGTEYTCREWRGVYLLTLEPLWDPLSLELSQRPGILRRWTDG